MNKLLEITVFSWCNLNISSVHFHAISVENTRLYSSNTYLTLILCELHVFPQKNTIQYICKIYAFYQENTCQNVITVGAKAR